MKKHISHILLFSILLTLFTPFLELGEYNSYNVYGNVAPELVVYQEGSKELEDIAERLGVEQTITVTNEGKTKKLTINKYWLNVFPKEKRLLVYGTREDVTYLHENNLNNGFWRFVGYNVEGKPMGNPNYPPDQGGTFHPKDRQWRKYTWDRENDIGIGYQWKHNEIRQQRQNGGSIIVPEPSIYTTTPEWMRKGTWTNGNGLTYSMSDFQLSGQLHEYIYVQQAPTDYTVGTGIMYHRDASGNWWYIQIIFKPTKPIESTHNVMEIGVLVHPTTNPAESYVEIDGKHYKFIRNLNNYDEDRYYKFHYGDEGTSITINQRPQPYYYVGNSYSEGIVLTKFPNGTYSESRTVVIKDEVQYLGFFYTEDSDLDVDFDIIYNGQNVTSQVQNGIPIKIKKTDFPLTLNFQDKSISELGQINSWDWTMLNQQTFAMENFATAKNPNKSFPTEENFRKYFNGNTIAVKLDVTDTFTNRGNKTKFIPFEIEEELSGARIVITGTADPVAIPHGYPWGSGKVDFTVKAMDLAPGEQILEWHTEQKRPRHESLGYTDKIKHETTGSQFSRTVYADVSHDKNRVWLRAELITNRGTYIKEGYVNVPTSQQSQPPIAVIEGPTVFSAGDKVYFDGTKSYSPVSSHYIEDYWWEMPGAANILTKNEYGWPDKMQSRIQAYFTVIGQHRIELDVWNNGGVVSRNPAVHMVTVTEPYPTAVISLGGSLKENRKVTLNSSGSTGNDIYPIVNSKTTWMIYPDGGQNVDTIKVDGNLNSTRLDLLFKEIGRYKVVLYVENTYGNHDIAEQIITIGQDLKPTVNISTPSRILRNPQNSNKATMDLNCSSLSPDGDTIAKREWFYRYDDNNDGAFTTPWIRIGEGKNVKFDVTQVGKYQIRLDVVEEFGQPTINQFVSPSDRRSNVGYSTVEAINTPPIVEFETKPKPMLDILVNVGDSKHKLVDIKSEITEKLEIELGARGIDYNIIYNDNRTSHNLHFYSVGSKYLYGKFYGAYFESYTYVNYLVRTHYYTGETEYLYLLPRHVAGIILMPNNRIYYLNGGNSWNPSYYTLWYYDLETGVAVQVYDIADSDYSGYLPQSLTQLRAGPNNKVYVIGNYYSGGYQYKRRYIFDANNNKTVGTPVPNTYFYGNKERDFQVLKNGFTFTDIFVVGFHWGRIFGGYRLPTANSENGNNALMYIAENTTSSANAPLFYKPEDYYNYSSNLLHIGSEMILHNGQPIRHSASTSWSWANYYLGVGRDYVYMNNGIRINIHTKEIESTPLNFTNATAVRMYGGRLYIPRSQWLSHSQEYDYNMTVYDETENKIIYNKKFTSNSYGNLPSAPQIPNEPHNVKYAKSLGNLSLQHPWREGSSRYIINIDDSSSGIVDTGVTGIGKEIGDVLTKGAEIINLEDTKYVVNANPQAFTSVDRSYWSAPSSITNSITINAKSNGYGLKQIRYSLTTDRNKPSNFQQTLNVSGLQVSRDINITIPQNSERFLHFEVVTENGNTTYHMGGPYSYYWDNEDDDEGEYSHYPSGTPASDELNKTNYIGQTHRTLVHVTGGMNVVNDSLDEFMEKTADYIIQEVEGHHTQYIILGEEMEYEFSYSDRENDPKFAERWRFTHDPNYYENSLGLLPQSGLWINNPIIKFLYTGRYEVLFQGRDNPKNDNRFDNYRLWSLEELSTTYLYVHRRPIANFIYAITNYNLSQGEYTFSFTSTSYDLDHGSKISKGIVQEEWSWLRQGETSFTPGKPTILKEGDIYYVRLRVKDLEGAWSTPYVAAIDVMDLPPIVNANPNQKNWTNQNINVQLQGTAFNGATVSKIKYHWSKDIISNTDSITWTEINGNSVNTSLTQNESWYLYARAVDSKNREGRVSQFGPYNLDKIPPGISVNRTTYTGEANIDVTVTYSDTGGSQLKLTQYAWSTSSATPTVWTNYPQNQSNLINENYGAFYLHLRAEDHAGNVTTRVHGLYTRQAPISIVATYEPNFINHYNLPNYHIPARERFNIVDIVTESIGLVEKLELAVYEGANRRTAIRTVNYSISNIINHNGNVIDWKNINDYQIPENLPDGPYVIELRAFNQYDTEEKWHQYIRVNTPVNLNLLDPPDQELIAGETYTFNAETSIYANTVDLSISELHIENISMTVTSTQTDKKVWIISLTIPEGYDDGLYSVTFTAKTPNGNEETQVLDINLLNLKLENLRITRILDFNWKDYFLTPGGMATPLALKGIPVKDMPVYSNKEQKGIKLGYKIKLKIDSMGLHREGDLINIEARYFALDEKNDLYDAEIYVEDSSGNYTRIQESPYFNSAGNMALSTKNRRPHGLQPEKETYNTWEFEVFIPYSAKVVKAGETLDLIEENSLDHRLLVVLGVQGEKVNGTQFDYTLRETQWGQDNGSIYGKNRPTRANLMGKGINHGEVFWYDLKNTAKDDFLLERGW